MPASALEGLPDDYVAAHPVDDDGTVAIGTGYPDTNPFLTFSADRDARHAVHATFLDLGWPANDAHLGELLALRPPGTFGIVARQVIHYHAELNFPSTIHIGAGIARIGSKSYVRSEEHTSELQSH